MQEQGDVGTARAGMLDAIQRSKGIERGEETGWERGDAVVVEKARIRSELVKRVLM